ncbi:MAG: DUF1015 domain-containing protein [Chloroflexi bacterium]|nr:DUF1015 domain-containing protein [Chloroflexota bacterium]
MAEVRPFRGLRYAIRAGASLTDLICPPYDVISPAQQQALEARSPHNAVHVELPRGEGDAAYANAARQFAQWQQQGILTRESAPSYYFMRHTFAHSGRILARWGLMAAVRLESYDRRIVLPHEETRPQAKEDRFRLMTACRANFSPIMCLYRDSQHRIRQAIESTGWKTPAAKATYNDEEISLWAVNGPTLDSAVQSALKDAPLFIADGHHRYETALRYRDEARKQKGRREDSDAFNYVMMTLIDVQDPGLLVLPYHRAVCGINAQGITALRNKLQEVFQLEAITPQPKTPQQLEEAVRQRPGVCMGLLGPDGEGPYMLTLRRGAARDELASLPGGAALRDSEGWVLHQAVFAPVLGAPDSPLVSYFHDPQQGWDEVLQGKLQMAFYTKPFPLDLFQTVVSAGQKLPPKSTYFHPKLPTGLVFNPLEGEL